jgi:hypothetical protein
MGVDLVLWKLDRPLLRVRYKNKKLKSLFNSVGTKGGFQTEINHAFYGQDSIVSSHVNKSATLTLDGKNNKQSESNKEYLSLHHNITRMST